MIAALAMSLSSASVVSNALRLRGAAIERVDVSNRAGRPAPT
jgi:hypothetical protein